MKRLLIAGSAAALAVAAGLVGATAYADSGHGKSGSLQAAAKAATAYVHDNGDSLHASKSEKFVRQQTLKVLGLTYTTYERTYKGLDVVGGDTVVATNSAGKIAFANTAQTHKIDLDTIKPSVSVDKVLSVAGKKASKPDVVVYARGKGDPVLAYVSTKKAVNSDKEPVNRKYYVDALSGKKIDVVDSTFAGTGHPYYNGKGDTVDIGTSKGGSGFVMEDPDHKGQSCGEEGKDPFTKDTDDWGSGDSKDLETACVDVLYDLGKEAGMLKDWLGYDGVDGKGGYFPSSVNLDDVNAYWDGSSTHFGHSQDGERNLTSIDIVAHENGHGIFQFTPGGSDGDNETGGINEGDSDIFGALTEWYANEPVKDGSDSPDYTVGEAAGLLNPGEPIRSMPDPSSIDNAPNCWSTDIPNTEVHAAAGPINHMFYMLAEGTEKKDDQRPGSKACDGSTIKDGLGIEQAGKVWMGALMGKTSGWTYADARTATLQFASSSDQFKTCDEYNAAKAAFDAISVPGDNDPTCSK
ncbi:MAG TPA: M4 family metallopeptidase [Stackebrandtia sp.]|jgi:Zn-dependent metalloprotease|uniref:M4 family metallopeptidase n=1 Tax=Stackebrandtia sp. TaxID=2023065 RepID=UPI002D57F6F3|nr:M4 family metallopeptidase [Stackebrandtia sp.]HZE39507.1 M4 family metallopeptidase [Stackebrandtia sp.]